jgi:hypothetical protein
VAYEAPVELARNVGDRIQRRCLSRKRHGFGVTELSDGTRLQASYWRLITSGRAELSSFDHEQQYGLPAPIDAKAELRKELDGRICIDARLDAETGNLLFDFDGGVRIQVFNFSGYEVWYIVFPDRSGMYSNYVLESLTPSAGTSPAR